MIVLPCVSAEGKPTTSGMTMLTALKNGASTPEAVSKVTGKPLFRARSGLRELVNAGFVKQLDGNYQLTPQGSKIVA